MALTPYQKHVQAVLKKGGTMKQAAASWKRPSIVQRIRNRRAARKQTKVNNTVNRRGRVRAYYHKHRKSGGALSNQKIFKLLRVAALLAPAAIRAVGPGTAEDKLKMGLLDYTGFNAYSGSFDWTGLMRGYTPFLATSLVTVGIPKLMGLIKGV